MQNVFFTKRKRHLIRKAGDILDSRESASFLLKFVKLKRTV